MLAHIPPGPACQALQRKPLAAAVGGGGPPTPARTCHPKLTVARCWYCTMVPQALEDANLKKDEIDEIVLVGGSTRIPKVQQLIKVRRAVRAEGWRNRGLSPAEMVQSLAMAWHGGLCLAWH